jgi:uncharacterized protein (DUF924 family)
MPRAAVTASDVLAFWFGTVNARELTAGRPVWFRPDAVFDAEVASRLGAASEAAVGGAYPDWEMEEDKSLALVLLLDQVPRNVHRGGALAFAGDGRARRVAGKVIARGGDRHLGKFQRLFLYLPFEHSESLIDQDRSCRLIGMLGDPDLSEYAERHRDIIQRFGRFPHRNTILGRESSAAERLFLAEPGTGF